MDRCLENRMDRHPMPLRQLSHHTYDTQLITYLDPHIETTGIIRLEVKLREIERDITG